METKNLSEVEDIKIRSNYLRGSILDSLADNTTGALAPDDVTLIKFHGSYQQTDRDVDSERKHQKLEPLYSFMIRIRLSGGLISPAQYLHLDKLADRFGSGTLKVTTRQAFQLHGVLKHNLKKTIFEINNYLMDTIAACGDVNRNVMCTPNPAATIAHAEIYALAARVQKHFTPRTTAYPEIWLNKQLLAGGNIEDEEPIYGKTYLPRKFKIAFAIPPYNDTDVYSNDLGFIAIIENSILKGFNVLVGGGLGMTFGIAATFPRLADIIGFCPKEKIIEVAEEILKIQRDFGNREDRKLSRFKYTIEQMGVEGFKQELYKRLGWELTPALPFNFIQSGDRYGWQQAESNGKWSLTLFIEGGRIVDSENYPLKTALRKAIELHDGDIRLSPNQNITIANISESNKGHIYSILTKYGIMPAGQKTGLRLNSLACVALNTCTMAFAEAERYLPSLLDKLDKIIIENGLEETDINIRMTGCPNGCARPYLGEIGFVGKAPGLYNVYLGAGYKGDRLNKLYKETQNEQQIIEILTPIIQQYAKERIENERLGDFVVRKNIVSC